MPHRPLGSTLLDSPLLRHYAAPTNGLFHSIIVHGVMSRGGCLKRFSNGNALEKYLSH